MSRAAITIGPMMGPSNRGRGGRNVVVEAARSCCCFDWANSSALFVSCARKPAFKHTLGYITSDFKADRKRPTRLQRHGVSRGRGGLLGLDTHRGSYDSPTPPGRLLPPPLRWRGRLQMACRHITTADAWRGPTSNRRVLGLGPHLHMPRVSFAVSPRAAGAVRRMPPRGQGPGPPRRSSRRGARPHL